MITADLLPRLDAVKATGAGRWVAKCPAHEDRSPSLSIREVETGATLLHCFAGCEVESVLDAVGLTFTDIMPPRIEGHYQRGTKPNHWHAAKESLRTISHESLLVAIAAENIASEITLTEKDRARVLQAANRIRRALEACA